MDTRKLLFVDVETTIRNTVGKNKASAFCKDNFIVYSGVMRSGDGCVSIVNGPAQPPTDEGYAVVGHNIKFDLHHLRAANEGWWEYVMRNGVWDTSIAEYLLTAQIEKYPSLDSCAVKYGGTVKDNRLKDEFWGKGIDTTEIPEDIILPYLEQDVLNTKIIAEAQIEEAERLGMMPLMRAMMSAMLATAEMEWNGLYVDLDRLESIQETLETERRSLLQKLEDEVIEMGLALPRDVLNLSSNKQLSAILFGGEVDYTDKEQIGFFKTGEKKGQPRYKNVPKSVMSKGLYTPKKAWENKLGYYSSSDDILSELFGEHGGAFLEGMLRLRWLNKQINTYAEGMKKLVMPDGLIHHNLQCTSTSTGRLSCTAPNLQNIPSQGDSEIKAYFSSRYGDKGRIISADYSQLEVVWLAWAAGDENMKNDIKNGVDFHCKRLALKVGEPYDDVVRKCKEEELPEWVEMRKKIKTFSFQRSYGAGAAAISAATGMSVEEVKEIIKNEEKAYPQLTQFYKQIQLEVERSVSAAEKVYKIENGIPLKYGFYVSPTGRRYHFPQSVFTYHSKQEMKQKTEASFSPTIIKNYPIQGGATGDLVPFMMAVLMHKLRAAGYGEKCLLINQVHDSIMLDTHADLVYDVCQLVKETLEDAPRLLGKHFGLDFDLPLGVDVEFGLNWKDQEKFVSTKKETTMVQGLVEAVTKEPRQDKYDNKFYNGVKIGDSWFNFPPDNTPAKGQVIEFEAPAKGNKIATFTVTDGSATATQAGPKQGKVPAGVEGQIKGMILNNAVQMAIAAAQGQPLTVESIVAAAEVVKEARTEIDKFEITV